MSVIIIIWFYLVPAAPGLLWMQFFASRLRDLAPSPVLSQTRPCQSSHGHSNARSTRSLFVTHFKIRKGGGLASGNASGRKIAAKSAMMVMSVMKNLDQITVADL